MHTSCKEKSGLMALRLYLNIFIIDEEKVIYWWVRLSWRRGLEYQQPTFRFGWTTWSEYCDLQPARVSRG